MLVVDRAVMGTISGSHAATGFFCSGNYKHYRLLLDFPNRGGRCISKPGLKPAN